MDWLEIFGYVASVIVAIGMTMSSLKALRWVNLIGAGAFAAYGFLINALPVGLLNAFIAVIDVYYLIQIYTKKEFFRYLNIKGDNYYLSQFLEFYKKNINKYYPNFQYKPEINKYSFFILRNMAIAGIVLAYEYEPEVLEISLDYTIPEYRDFKVGKYLYDNYHQFKKDGYKTLIAFPLCKSQEKYFKKMGFDKINYNGKIAFTKNLT